MMSSSHANTSKIKNDWDEEHIQSRPLLLNSAETETETGTKDYGIISNQDSINHNEEDDDMLMIPQIIRDVVLFEDDPNIPVLTFRYFFLSTIFVIPGAFIDTINSYRTTSAAYSIFFVQISCHWIGKFLARVLPSRTLNFFGFRFSLNPGPWSIKETAMITITANSGATGNLATNAISLAELYFGETVKPITAILFMFAIVFIGYSYAAIAKPFLLYDPQFPWPQALMQTTLLRSQEKTDSNVTGGNKQMKVFLLALTFVFFWQFFPEFLFPLTSSIAVLCYIAPHNSVINFIGSGIGGMGFLNFSLDWSNITSSIFIYPYWIQVIQFVAFVIVAYILIPLVQFGNIFNKAGLMSNGLFTADGQTYPVHEILTPDLKLNTTALQIHGNVYIGAQRAWDIFFDYAAYISGVIWVVLFGYDKFRNSLTHILKSSKEKTTIRYSDRLNKLQRNYNDVPSSWYFYMFLVSFITLSMIFLTDQMFMKWRNCVIALLMGSIIVTPLAWLYALSNFQLSIGTFNELLYGYLIVNDENKHPAGALVFGSIAGDAWYRAQFHLDCMRLGFYNHLPPRAVFFSQIYGELIGIPINYLALRWVLDTKKDFLVGNLIDPLHQWTGQTIASAHTNAIQYVVLGPKVLFSNYPLLPYGFLMGFVAPLLLFSLYKRFPNSKLNFNLWNTTVFFSSMGKFYGNLSTGYLSKFIGGTITMYWAFNYKNSLWKKYNYILAAAFDTGLNLAVLVLFILMGIYPNLKMPYWWGNNKDNIERCFALS